MKRLAIAIVVLLFAASADAGLFRRPRPLAVAGIFNRVQPTIVVRQGD